MQCTTRRELLQGALISGGMFAMSQTGCHRETAVESLAPAKMAIARWSDKLDPAAADIKQVATRLTEQAIAALGGMKQYVSRGDVVWIKPNIGFHLGPEFAVNTNPDVVATLVRLCLDAGAKQVKVGDNSCYGAQKAYPVSGIEAAIQPVGGEMVYIDPARIKKMKLDGERLYEWPLVVDIAEADVMIDVPILKHHGLSQVTVCMKNLMGTAGGARYQWHTDLPRCLPDVAAFLRPKLCVVDAVRVLTNHGPEGGDLADVDYRGIVAAGGDMVALEAFGAETLGCDPKKGRTMANAQARGLGTIDFRSLNPREVQVA